MSKQEIIVTVPEHYEGERLDKFIVSCSGLDYSRSYITKIIRLKQVSSHGEILKANYRVKADQEIIITIPEVEKLDLSPQDIPLEILYQDSDIAVINKQPGLIVHPGAGAYTNTLVNALLFHLKDLSAIGGVERPGIVHRLDRDTGGLMVIAKSDKAHLSLAKQFEERTIKKFYSALVIGKPRLANMIIEQPIGRHPKYRQKMKIVEGGRYAKSEITFRKGWDTDKGSFSLLKVRIYTGRTHQIRVHLSSEGLPIVGDPIYSKSAGKFKVPYLLLAAVNLSFSHPITGEEMSFQADLPAHMQNFIDQLDRSS